MMTEKEIKDGMEEASSSFLRLQEVLEIEKKRNELKDLEAQVADMEIWKDRKKGEETSRKAGEVRDLIEKIDEISLLLEKLKEKFSEELYFVARKKLKEIEVKTTFTGRYDKSNAIFSIYSGAGGQDAADWTGMLLDMFTAFFEKMGFKWRIVDESLDDFQTKTGRKPIKNITLEVRGNYAFGYLKGEAGVHRLVRISPFSPKKLRHTSFALVEVLPDIAELQKIEITEKDLKVDLFRSSGPGGQNVNKVETAVRITHLPTGIVAACQVERSQSQNRERAMAVIHAKLLKLMEENKVKEISELKTKVKPEWGSQIRSYVLNPYKMVKDHRTGMETTQAEKVLQGELDDFIQAELVNSFSKK